MSISADILFERLSSLHRSLMRQVANEHGLQLVHVEILQYLDICNRYSNTAQALTEYLGQTKGSISQSLKFLEENGLVERAPCEKDKRITRLTPSKRARTLIGQLATATKPAIPDTPENIHVLRNTLRHWQATHVSSKSFGQCQTCRFYTRDRGLGFRCGLTQEVLTTEDSVKICREHQHKD